MPGNEQRVQLTVTGQVNRDLLNGFRALRRELDQFSKTIANISSNVSRFDSLGESMKRLRDAARRTGSDMGKLSPQFERLAQHTGRLAQESRNAVTSVKALGKTHSDVTRLGDAAGKAAKELGALRGSGQVFTNIIAGLKNANAEFRKLATSAKNINKMFNAMSGVAKQMRDFGRAVEWVTKRVEAARKAETDLIKAKTQLRNVTEQTRNSLDKTNNSLGKMGQLATEAKQKTGLLILGLKQVGFVAMSTGVQMARTGDQILRTFLAVIRASTQFSHSMQSARISMEQLLGSGPATQYFLRTLLDFAVRTPMTFDTIVNAAQRLLGFGFAAQEVIPTLKALGNATRGDVEPFNRAMLQLAQIRAKPFLEARDVKELANSVPAVYQVLQEKLNLSKADIFNAGKMKIEGTKAAEAIVEGFNERFGNVMEQVAKTPTGVLMNIQDLIQQAFSMPDKTGLGDQLLEGLRPGLEAVFDFLMRIREDGTLAKLADGFREFGLSLSQAIQSILPVIHGLIQAFNNLSPSMRAFLLTALVGSGILLKFAGSTLFAVGQILSLSGGFAGLIASSGGFFTFLKAGLPWMGLFAIGAVAATIGVQALIKAAGDAKTPIGKLFEDAGLLSKSLQVLGPNAESTAESLKKLGDAGFTPEQVGRVDEMLQAVNGIREAWENLKNAVGEVAEKIGTGIRDALKVIGIDFPSSLAGAMKIVAGWVNVIANLIKGPLVQGAIQGATSALIAVAGVLRVIFETVNLIIAPFKAINDFAGGILGTLLGWGIQFLVFKGLLVYLARHFSGIASTIILIVYKLYEAGFNLGRALTTTNSLKIASIQWGNALQAVLTVISMVVIQLWQGVQAIAEARKQAALARQDEIEGRLSVEADIRKATIKPGVGPLGWVSDIAGLARGELLISSTRQQANELVERNLPELRRQLERGELDIAKFESAFRKAILSIGKDADELMDKIEALAFPAGSMEYKILSGRDSNKYAPKDTPLAKAYYGAIIDQARFSLRDIVFTELGREVAMREAMASIDTGTGLPLPVPARAGGGAGDLGGKGGGSRTDRLRPFRNALQEAEQVLEIMKHYGASIDQIIAQIDLVLAKRMLLGKAMAAEEGTEYKPFYDLFQRDRDIVEQLKRAATENAERLLETIDISKTSYADFYEMWLEANSEINQRLTSLVAPGDEQTDRGRHILKTIRDIGVDVRTKFLQDRIKSVFDQFSKAIPDVVGPKMFGALQARLSEFRQEFIGDELSEAILKKHASDAEAVKKIWTAAINTLEKEISRFGQTLVDVGNIRNVSDAINYVQGVLTERVKNVEVKTPPALQGIYGMILSRSEFGLKAMYEYARSEAIAASEALKRFKDAVEGMFSPVAKLKEELADLLAGPAKTDIEAAERELDKLTAQFNKLADSAELSGEAVAAIKDIVEKGVFETEADRINAVAELLRTRLGPEMAAHVSELTKLFAEIESAQRKLNEEREKQAARERDAAQFERDVTDYLQFTSHGEKLQRQIQEAIDRAVREISEGKRPRIEIELELFAELEAIRAKKGAAIIADGIVAAIRNAFGRMFEGFFEGRGIGGFLTGLGEGLKNIAQQLTQHWVDKLFRQFMPTPFDPAVAELQMAGVNLSRAAAELSAAASSLADPSLLSGTVTEGSKDVALGLKQIAEKLAASLAHIIATIVGGALFGGSRGAAVGSALGSQMGPGLLSGMLGQAAFTQLGAFGGPLGMLGGAILGGFIGNIFGKSDRDRQQEELDRRRNEILNRIDNSLRPVSDYFRVIGREALFGPDTAYFSGRGYATTTARGGR